MTTLSRGAPAAEQGDVARDHRPSSSSYWHASRNGRRSGLRMQEFTVRCVGSKPSSHSVLQPLSSPLVVAGKRIPVETMSSSGHQELGELANEKKKKKFATNLLRKRRTYAKWFDKMMLPGGRVDVACTRVAIVRSLEIGVTNLPVGRIYELRRIDRVECSREIKEKCQKYSRARLVKVEQRVANLQALDRVRVDRYFSERTRKKEVAVVKKTGKSAAELKVCEACKLKETDVFVRYCTKCWYYLPPEWSLMGNQYVCEKNKGIGHDFEKILLKNVESKKLLPFRGTDALRCSGSRLCSKAFAATQKVQGKRQARYGLKQGERAPVPIVDESNLRRNKLKGLAPGALAKMNRGRYTDPDHPLYRKR